MKTYIISIILLLTLNHSRIQAQEIPQWLFPIAFEDATGARDTVWIGMDEEGTFGPDAQFGEVPKEFDENEFGVFFYLDTDLNKSDYFVLPISIPPGGEVYAMNYEYPITVSWDTTLFNVPLLTDSPEGPINNPLMDNEYFFGFHGAYGAYHMLFDNEAEMPFFSWGSMDHFPVSFSFHRGFGDPLSSDNIENGDFQVWPNPAVKTLRFNSLKSVERVRVYGLSGRLYLDRQVLGSAELNISVLPIGAYLVHLSGDGFSSVSKFVKVGE